LPGGAWATRLLSADIALVRPGEELNLRGLAAYFDGRIAGDKIAGTTGAALEVDQFPNGHSNLVYLVGAARGNTF
jgi:hypothetical protein